MFSHLLASKVSLGWRGGEGWGRRSRGQRVREPGTLLLLVPCFMAVGKMSVCPDVAGDSAGPGMWGAVSHHREGYSSSWLLWRGMRPCAP